VEQTLITLRLKYPAWGSRKLCRLLERQGIPPPPERTANRILRRHGLVDERSPVEEPLRRFERDRPNVLWQMDHKRAIHGSWAVRTVPLVIADDASRFLITLRAQPDMGLDAMWAVMWWSTGEPVRAGWKLDCSGWGLRHCTDVRIILRRKARLSG
jgi:hypothetical protein